ncbi:uncharacterized protein UTRI_10185 [Ustilago trichophora]|uniref:Uncharacterized protein n=1 Tax=Ustilago trichophora TaxID=86804 RepID=A0A5C3EEE4_9BASI|nr:uncharacterized protein UTRI_10185 [Ustilago trichophora]
MSNVNKHGHDHPVDDHDNNFYQCLKHWHSSTDKAKLNFALSQITYVLSTWSEKAPDHPHNLRAISNPPVYTGLRKSIQNNPKLDLPLVSKIVHKTVTIDEAKCQIDKFVSSHEDGFSEYLKSLDNLKLLIIFTDALFDAPDSESSHNKSEIFNKDKADSEVWQSFAATFRGPAVKLLVAHLKGHERGNRRHRDAAALHRRQEEGHQAEETDDVEMQDTDHLPALASTSSSSSPLAQPLAASNTALTAPSSTLNPTSSEEEDMYYAKVLPIIQSSGFGKTKLCVTLSASHPGMLVCMRPKPKVAVLFPPQGTKVFDYFNECYQKYFLTDVDGAPLGLGTLEQNHVHVYIVSFLAAYCNKLHSLLSQIMLISGCPPLSSFLGLAAAAHPSNSSPSATTDTHQVAQCWNLVIHALATAIHVKPGFLAQLELQLRQPICPHSKVWGQDFANPTPSAIAALIQRFPDQHKNFVGKLAGPTTCVDMLKCWDRRPTLLLALVPIPDKSYSRPLDQEPSADRPAPISSLLPARRARRDRLGQTTDQFSVASLQRPTALFKGCSCSARVPSGPSSHVLLSSLIVNLSIEVLTPPSPPASVYDPSVPDYPQTVAARR